MPVTTESEGGSEFLKRFDFGSAQKTRLSALLLLRICGYLNAVAYEGRIGDDTQQHSAFIKGTRRFWGELRAPHVFTTSIDGLTGDAGLTGAPGHHLLLYSHFFNWRRLRRL